MKSLKVKNVEMNNRKKCFEITLSNKQEFTFPYSRLELKPTTKNKIEEVYIDKEVGPEGLTYILENGKEDTILVDYILDYHADPEYMKDLRLHEMTAKALNVLEKKKITRSELRRRMKCSAMQLNRLLDPAFYGKSTDQMIKLLRSLDYDVKLVYKRAS